MACAVLFIDSGPYRAAFSASVASTRRSVSGSLIRSVCHTMVAASRALIAPSAKSAATRGTRSRSATAKYIWPDAMPWVMPCAAETSAAIASQLSHDHWAWSTGPIAWRRTSSAMAASRRADAAASARAQSAMAATTVASSARTSASAPCKLSNILSILAAVTDKSEDCLLARRQGAGRCGMVFLL